MNEEERLKELYEYQILDTKPEVELDELAEIASVICNSPISLITFIDDHRQWYKAKKGMDIDEVPREISFCKHVLLAPHEVLLVEDSLDDERFFSSPFVTGSPYIRFYVGVPLESNAGNVMGTLCVMDTKPKKLLAPQKKALQILARKAMKYLHSRKQIKIQQQQIKFDAVKLKKLTDNASSIIFQFEMDRKREMRFKFINKAISEMHPTLFPQRLMKTPSLIFDVIHPEDLPMVKQSIEKSYESLEEWNVEYRIIHPDGKVDWYQSRAKPEKKRNGIVVWYGTSHNITSHIEYEKLLEDIAFDISHVLRRPITSLIGLTSLFDNVKLTDEQIKTYSHYVNRASVELDAYTRKLNETYGSKRKFGR